MSKMVADELDVRIVLSESDPHKTLALCDEFIAQNLNDPCGYFCRHFICDRLGRDDPALQDAGASIDLHPHPLSLADRGILCRKLGRYREAVEDFDRADTMAPGDLAYLWSAYFRADFHARLGNEEAALANCARLSEDHRGPGLYGAPAGDRRQVAAEIRRRAALAQCRLDSRS